MAQNNVVAEGVEKLGCRTFSTEEMAFNIVGLMHQRIADRAMTKPLWADFTGGMDKVEGLDRAMAEMRQVCGVCRGGGGRKRWEGRGISP